MNRRDFSKTVGAAAAPAAVPAAKLSGQTFAKALQLNIECDPRPPFHAGSPHGAGEAITAAMWAIYKPIVALGRQAARG